MRAAYSAGVVDGLRKAGVVPDAVVGSSSGSMNAAFCASGQTDTLCKLWADYIPGNRFISYRRLVTPWGPPGLDVDKMLDEIVDGQNLLDEKAATEGPTALYVVSTNIANAQPLITRPNADNIYDWLRASHAIPVGYNRIVELDGMRLVDGGVAAPVPFDLPLETPCDGPTVVILTRKMSTHKPRPNWWQRFFLNVIVPPDVRGLSMRQHELHNGVMARLSREMESSDIIVVDPPDELQLSRLTRDKKRIHEGIDLGRRRGAELAEKLQTRN